MPQPRLRLEPLEDRTALSNYTAGNSQELIAAVNLANAAGGANTITLTAPASSPYDLTAANNTTDGPTGLPVISGGGKKGGANSLTILGNGDVIERSAAAGTPPFRLFDVAGQASLTLVNLTLQNGLAFGSGAAAEGGAVYNQGTLVLNGVTVQNNTAQGANGATITGKKSPPPGADAAGGAIWTNGSLTLQNGTALLGNSAVGGDGGLNSTYPTIQGAGGSAFGGALHVAGGSANVNGGSVSGNWTRNGVDVDGNSVSHSLGGGLYLAAGTATVTGGTLSDNRAGESGGGIYSAGSLTVSGSTLARNAAVNGGGIYNAVRATATVTAISTLSFNHADDSGGAVYNAGTLAVSDSTLSGNSAYASSEYFVDSEGGGGIYNSGSLTFNHSTLANNHAFGASAQKAGGSGGGILNFSTGTANVLNGSTLSGNTADLDGGGIANVGTLAVSNCLLSGNSANSLYVPSGGAIYSGGTLKIIDSILSDNSAYAGGAVECSGTVTMSGCTLSGNSASAGGAVFLGGGGTLTVSGTTFTGNSATDRGGAIFNEGALTLTGCTLTGNVATVKGGGIYSYTGSGSGVVYLSNSTLGANSPDNVFGGYVDQGGNIFY